MNLEDELKLDYGLGYWSSCRYFSIVFEVVASTCECFLCSYSFPCPACDRLCPPCSKPCLSFSKPISYCSFSFLSSSKEYYVLGLLKVTDLVVGLLTSVMGDLVFVLGGVTSLIFPSLHPISSFFLGDSSIIIGTLAGVCGFPCLILVLFLVMKYI